jgi:hypothetical protein
VNAGFWLRAAALWVGMLALALAAGGLREWLYVPLLGRPWAEALTTAKLIALWVPIVYGFLVWQGAPIRADLLHGLGALWAVLALGAHAAVTALAGGAPGTPGVALRTYWPGALAWVLAAALYATPLLVGWLLRVAQRRA